MQRGSTLPTEAEQLTLDEEASTELLKTGCQKEILYDNLKVNQDTIYLLPQCTRNMLLTGHLDADMKKILPLCLMQRFRSDYTQKRSNKEAGKKNDMSKVSKYRCSYRTVHL